MEKNVQLSGTAKRFEKLEWVEAPDLVNKYCFGQPTEEEIQILKNKGYVLWGQLLDPETKEYYEMWLK